MASQFMKNEREISEVDDTAAKTSVPIDGIVEEMTTNIAPKLLHVSPLPASCCIFRVPLQIRQKNAQAYEPYVISIGPFHRGRGGDQFRLMENVKRWYLQCLLSHAKETLPGLIKGVSDLDKRARDCYVEPLGLNKEDFVEMMVLDGCFLIELFRKGPSHDLQDEKDPVYCMSGIRLYLYHDLLLLENQLPWFVLERLYNLTAVKNTTSEGNASSLADLVLKFFRKYVGDNCILNSSVNLRPEILHILDLIRTAIIATSKDDSTGEEMPRVPNVTTLSEAGIKFEAGFKCKEGPSGGILNMKFEKGKFTMPQLVIDERTGPLLRNLIAFEQCYPSCPHMITSYAVLMDNLINSSKDIDLLCERKILVNWLSSEDAAKFFNELYNDTTVVGSYYGQLCNDVNEYYEKNWNKWMEKLKREHFNSPWAIISLVAAFILLALTVLQTYYTIHPYYYPPK
ncbi:UPF0481 protein At3g47200-like [Pyrus x bretschneideri]|uniref:UPF0481 protein At3g47200-like n=1 Tax=Pyrus x bretschneideri TaxID=225117 RepID=UPI00202F523D|nr:UPF0481 protein At3g47200-like [Pyrus x bretschneideri]